MNVSKMKSSLRILILIVFSLSLMMCASPSKKTAEGIDIGFCVSCHQRSSRVEALYYRMYQFQNVYTWKGAYHFSADFAHWHGWAHLQMPLIEIKEEARKLEN
jgi:nitrate/TMAO reductase-like tetraheme cytochrome c subunit